MNKTDVGVRVEFSVMEGAYTWDLAHRSADGIERVNAEAVIMPGPHAPEHEHELAVVHIPAMQQRR